ncbi:MAG: acetate--CoA ligase [Elusimicrobia bacterium]|nr:acetate--CoA ligase [Elusimicrobiota bacterium]
MKKENTENITTLLKENRLFHPPIAFKKAAHISGFSTLQKLKKTGQKNPELFWAQQAKNLKWIKPFKKTLVWNPPFAQWFLGGKINVSENCLDRHLTTFRKNKAAILWEGEPGDTRTLTYAELHREVCRFANVLKSLGISKGDRVSIYLPMIPELPIAMLACARIGATHSVIFGGFSSEALKERNVDAQAKLLITADGGYRKGQIVPLKINADSAVTGSPSIEKVVVVRRTGESVPMVSGRDFWWHDLMKSASPHCPPEPLDSEHPLFILYTSGSTGKPKGVLHTTAGYLTQAAWTTKHIFDLKEEDTYWCTADIGWVTGHTYIVYGPLANGVTTVMYEGAPLYPQPDRFWELVEKYKVNIFYTAPTAIRTFVKFGDEWPNKHDLSSLRLLGTVGEPINPQAWLWYHKVIGGSRCPIVDTWWQTETGAIMISPLPGATPLKPGSGTLSLPGIQAEVVDKTGKPVASGQGGYLVIQKPWPAMLRTIYGDSERFKKQYWSQIPGIYFTGDGARKDKDGYFWIMGRIDDVIKVSGHRLGTAEIESALVSHPKVAEAAVVGRPDEITGEGIVAFVTLQGGVQPEPALSEILREHVSKTIGSVARPAEIRFTDTLPKTRSGKIMRRLLRELATSHQVKGDVTTLEDFSVLTKLQTSYEEEEG